MNLAQAQIASFEQRFNLNYSPPAPPDYKSERCNSGIRTQFNFDAASKYYSSLPSGVYILTVGRGNFLLKQKVVKQ